MSKKKIKRVRVTRKKMDFIDEYLYAFKTCNDGKLPHEKFRDLDSIIYYYNMYYKSQEQLTIKEYLFKIVLPYVKVKKRDSIVSKILNMVEDTDEEILDRAIKNKIK